VIHANSLKVIIKDNKIEVLYFRSVINRTFRRECALLLKPRPWPNPKCITWKLRKQKRPRTSAEWSYRLLIQRLIYLLTGNFRSSLLFILDKIILWCVAQLKFRFLPIGSIYRLFHCILMLEVKFLSSSLLCFFLPRTDSK